MDDEDIKFDSDNPELRSGELHGSSALVSRNTPSALQVQDAKRLLLAYIVRPSKAKEP